MISICIIAIQWRHYLSVQLLSIIITIYDQRNMTPIRNAIRRETNQLDLPIHVVKRSSCVTVHGSRFDLSLYIFKVKLCPLRRVSPLAKKVTSGIRPKPCMILCVSSRSPSFVSLPTLSDYTPSTSAHMATFSMKLSSW